MHDDLGQASLAKVAAILICVAFVLWLLAGTAVNVVEGKTEASCPPGIISPESLTVTPCREEPQPPRAP